VPLKNLDADFFFGQQHAACLILDFALFAMTNNSRNTFFTQAAALSPLRKN